MSSLTASGHCALSVGVNKGFEGIKNEVDCLGNDLFLAAMCADKNICQEPRNDLLRNCKVWRS